MTITETLREACPRCDRPRAPMAELTRRFREAADSDDPTPWTQHVAAFEAEHSDECVSYPSGSCSGRPVDWRQRALDAESRLRTLTTEAAASTGGEPTDEATVEAIASWLETHDLFRGDTERGPSPIYERAWNNARHDAARRLRNGNWRKP